MSEIFDLAIIGAGPAGMMAALSASDCGASVVLLEKNRIPGVKLLMTGKDRCNITNSLTDARQFAEVFGRNGTFLLSALLGFGIEETINFFHEHGLKTKVERGGRIFPESDRAKDVQQLLVNLMEAQGIRVLTNCRIASMPIRDGSIEKIVLDDKSVITAKNYLIATGGLSYPRTGSTGDGYAWASQMGHTIITPRPSLTPVLVEEPWVKDLEGLSLKNVSISIYQGGRKRDERFGEALFTANGMSGPIILDMSKSIGSLIETGKTDLIIDFKPALDFPKLDKRILRDFDENKNRAIKNILPALLPKSLIPVILRIAQIDPEKKGNAVTKEERKRLRLCLKQLPLRVTGLLGFNKAIITTGGVSLKEVDTKTMRSKIIKNLFFAGEILDLDGPTGGYNLQVCWSTGHLAGKSAASAK